MDFGERRRWHPTFISGAEIVAKKRLRPSYPWIVLLPNCDRVICLRCEVFWPMKLPLALTTIGIIHEMFTDQHKACVRKGGVSDGSDSS